jgi:hypothetical protein
MTDEQRDRMLDRLLENQVLQRLEENQAHHDTVLQKLEELQMTDHIAISRLNNQLADFQEQHRAALLEIDNRMIRLQVLIEAFVRGGRHNGGGQES